MTDGRAVGPLTALAVLGVAITLAVGGLPVAGSPVAGSTDDVGRNAERLQATDEVRAPTAGSESGSGHGSETGLLTPTATPDGVIDGVNQTTENGTSTVENATENTTSTVTNTTENTTSTVSNETGEVVDNSTSTVTTETGEVVEDTAGTVTNETSDVVANTTSNVTNAIGNATSTVSNETGTVIETTAKVTDVVVVDYTVGAGGSGVGAVAVLSPHSPAGSTGVIVSTGSEGRPAAVHGGTGEPTLVGSGDRSDDQAAAGGRRGGSGPVPRPSPGGAALGGALVVAGVAAAAASKQVAVSTSAPQGQELAWLFRATRERVGVSIERLQVRFDRLPRFLPLGYSRHDDSDPLEHEVRRSLFERVERSPGVNLSTLADGADVSMSTVRHHLRILEEENLLVSERIRGQRRYFLSNESRPALVAAMDDAATRPILQTLARTGPATVSDLAEALGRDPSTVSHHVSRLEEDGLVDRERDGRSVRNSLAPVAERVLSQHGPTRQRPVATE